jgi:hypothetical protein
MLALFRKEARQVLIAHAILAVLYSALFIALAPDGWLFLPEARPEEIYFGAALVAMLHGVLIGMGVFGLESWARTEAYVLHRGVGPAQIFWTKALAGLLALALVLFVPIAVYGTWHLALFPTIEGARATSLFHLAAAASASVPALAIGAFAARMRKAWLVRWLYALLGLSTLVLTMRWTAVPLGAEILLSAGRFAASQIAIAAFLLAVGGAMFRAGDDVHRPWRGRAGLLAAGVSLALFWTPYAVGISELQVGLTMALFERSPTIVERPGGELVRVQRDDDDFEFWSVDANERRTSVEPLEDYRGWGTRLESNLDLFAPLRTPIALDEPLSRFEPGRAGAFDFDGRAVKDSLGLPLPGVRYETIYTFLRSPRFAVHTPVLRSARSRLEWIDVLPDGSAIPERGQVRIPLRGHGVTGSALLVDLDRLGMWRFPLDGSSRALEPIGLPDDDTLVGFERIEPVFRARVGLYERFGTSDDFALVGRQDRYLWTADGFVAESDAARFRGALAGVLESGVPSAQAWRLEPSGIDGVSFHLAVIDVKTGEVVLEHDYVPRSGRQRGMAAGAVALSLARPAIGSLWSFVGHPYDEREVIRRAGMLRDPYVANGVRPWLALAIVALGIVLAVSTWRWIGHAAEDRAARWFWTIAVALLGLPAWVLCRVLETSRRVVALRMPKSGERSEPMLQTPRDVRVAKLPLMQV